MRRFVVVIALCALALAVPSTARAACAGFVSAQDLRDKVVDAKVHSSKLHGDKATAAIANLKAGEALAESCVTTGSTASKAASLAVAAQLRWNQACVLSFDGVASDKSAAVTLAKASDREMNAFEAKNSSLSGDAQALFDNWEHFDGDIESGSPSSCLE